MISVNVSSEIQEKVSGFKIGVLAYHDIAVSEATEILLDQLDDVQKEIGARLQEKSYADIPGLQEWRRVFKALGTDPSRYRPSAEALYRRVKKENKLSLIHSVADLNNYFSLKYEIPLGIYDLDRLEGPVEIRVGGELDSYEGINGRQMNMGEKLLSADANGAFGSPIVDSKRTMVTNDTTNALQIVYLRPSMSNTEAEQLLQDIETFSESIQGGTRKSTLISS